MLQSTHIAAIDLATSATAGLMALLFAAMLHERLRTKAWGAPERLLSALCCFGAAACFNRGWWGLWWATGNPPWMYELAWVVQSATTLMIVGACWLSVATWLQARVKRAFVVFLAFAAGLYAAGLGIIYLIL